jgi:thiamine-phosphate pyrophosphorylase
MTQPLRPPSIYLITDRQAFRRNPNFSATTAWQAQLAALRLAAQAGCPFIQIREKDLSARQLTEFVRAAVCLARPFGAKVLVNDRLDVAWAAGADGVHLRVNSLPAAAVREQAQTRGLPDFLLGVSTHSLAEATIAARAGANFIVCGPIYDTPSKREFGVPLGLERLSEICRAIKIPVFALGGISLANFHEALAQGAAGIAGISLFSELDQIAATIQTILNHPLSNI